MSKPNTPGKLDEWIGGVQALSSADANLASCRLLMLAVEKEEAGKVNEELFAGLVSMGELREQFRQVIDKVSAEPITFDNIAELPRYSMLIATNLPQEEDHRAYFLEEGDLKYSLLDTIEHARRITEQNIMRWLYEIFTCLSIALQRFITLRRISVNHISLESDRSHLLSLVRYNRQFIKYRHGKYNIGRTRMRISDLDEDARHAWMHLIPSPDEEGFPYQEDLYCRVHDVIRAGDQVLRSGQLNRVNSEEKKEELHTDYVAFIRRVQRSYRDFGAIAIQLATRTLLTDDEERRLRNYQYSPPISKDIAKQHQQSPAGGNIKRENSPGKYSAATTPRHLSSQGASGVGAGSEFAGLSRVSSAHATDSARTRPSSSGRNTSRTTSDDNSDEERDADDADMPAMQETESDMMKHIMQDLSRWFPSLVNCRSEIRDLIAICYAPMTPFLTLHGTSYLSFPIPYIPRLKAILSNMHNQVIQYYHDTLYEPPDIWDEQVLKYREETKQRYLLEMEEKAKKGFDRAHKRIQQERYQLWLSMQTEDYRRKRLHRKKMQVVTRQHEKERDRLIHAALFHTWTSQDLIKWLTDALNQYFKVAEAFKIKMEKNDQTHKRKVMIAQHQHQLAAEAAAAEQKQQHDAKVARNRGRAQSPGEEKVSQDAGVHAILQGSVNRLIFQQAAQKPSSPKDNNKNSSKDKDKNSTKEKLPPPIPQVTDSSLLYNRVDDVHIKRVLEEVFLPMDPYFTTKLVGTFCTGGSKDMVVKAMEQNYLMKAQETAKSEESKTKGASSGRLPKIGGTRTAGKDNAAKILSPALQRKEKLKQKKEEMVLLQQDESYRVHRMSQEEKVIFCLSVIAREWPVFFVPHVTSYQLCSAMSNTIKAVEEQCEDLEQRGKFLVISDEQLFYKQNALQSIYFQTQCTALRTSSFGFCDNMQIVDRSRARKLVACVASACMYQYVKDAQVRLAGEIIAADRIRGLFRMITARKRLYPIIKEKSKASIQQKQLEQEQVATGTASVSSRSSSSTMATLASHAMAATRASIIQKRQQDEDQQRKYENLSAKSSVNLSGIDSDLLSTLLGKADDSSSKKASASATSAPQTHNDMILQQLLMTQKQQDQDQHHSKQLAISSDRSHTLSTLHSIHIMSPNVPAGSTSSRPSLLSGSLQHMPGSPKNIANSVEEFATNRLMMVGMNNQHQPQVVLDDEGKLSVASKRNSQVADDKIHIIHEEENDKGEEEDNFDDEADDDEFVSVVNDVDALSMDEESTKLFGISKKSRKVRKKSMQSSKNRQSSNTLPVSGVSHASVIDGNKNVDTDRVVEEADDNNSKTTTTTTTTVTENNSKQDKKAKTKPSSEITTPYPVLQLSVNNIKGDSMRVKFRILVGSMEYAEDIASELEEPQMITVYRPKLRPSKSPLGGHFSSLQSTSSGTTPLFFSVKSKGQQVFEKYGGFQDFFHRHHGMFIALPSVQEYRVCVAKYSPSEQECKLLPLEVIPPHMRSKFAAEAATTTSKKAPNEGGLKMITTKTNPKKQQETSQDDKGDFEGQQSLMIPLPTHSVDIEMTVVGLHPVHRYEMYMTVDQKLSERLCRYYLPPLSSIGKSTATASSSGAPANGLVKHDHPFRAANNASILHAMKTYDLLTIDQRLARYMPMIPPPPPAIAAFTPRLPYLSVMSLSSTVTDSAMTSSSYDLRPTTASSIPEDTNGQIDETVTLLMQTLQDHSHATTGMVALNFSQGIRTVALRPEAPYPFDAKISYRSLGHSVRLFAPEHQSTHASEKVSTSKGGRLRNLSTALSSSSAKKEDISAASDSSSAISSLLSFFLGDERPPTMSMRVLSHLSWSASSDDIPRNIFYEVQRRLVLRPLAQIGEWKKLGLIDDGTDIISSEYPQLSDAEVKTAAREKEDNDLKELQLQKQKKKDAKKAFLGDDDDDKRRDENSADKASAIEGDNNRPDSAIDRVLSRSANQRRQVRQDSRPLSSVATSSIYKQEQVILGAWALVRTVPSSSLDAVVQFEDLFSLTTDSDSLLSTPIQSFLEQYVENNRSVLSGVAPFSPLPSSLLLLPHDSTNSNTSALIKSGEDSKHSGWCYVGYDVFVEYRVRVCNSAGDGEFARHSVFLKPHAHYHADPQQQALLNKATIEQESFRLASLMMKSLIVEGHARAKVKKATTPSSLSEGLLGGRRDEVKSSSPSRDRTPVVDGHPDKHSRTVSRDRNRNTVHTHPVLVAALQEQYHRQEELEKLRQQRQEQEDREHDLANNENYRGNLEDDPWLKHLAIQSPFLLD